MKLLVSSAQRLSGTSDNFRAYLRLQSASCVSLQKVILPNTFYNITALNNHLSFSDANGTASVFISYGSYTVSSLLAYIQTQMNVLSSGYTVSYSATTFSVTIAGSSAGIFALFPSHDASVLPTIGFHEDLSGQFAYTGTAVSLQNPTSVFITIAEFPSEIVSASNKSTFTWVVPNTVPPGTIGDYQVGVDFPCQEIRMPPSSFNIVSLSLSDQDGNALSLNGSEWSFVVSVS